MRPSEFGRAFRRSSIDPAACEQSGLRGLSKRGFTALDHAGESIGRRGADQFRAFVDAGDLRGAGG